MHRKDIVSRSSNINVRVIDKNIKNTWKWEWLDKEVNGIYLRECIRKLQSPGVAYCIICSKELYYKSRGCVALTDHAKSEKHKTGLKLRKDNFALPGASHCSKEEAPYGLHPMYAVHSLKAEVNVPQPSTPVIDRVANNEAMLLSFLAEKSLPFSIAPDLIALAKQLSNDKKALNRMTMHRTAAAYKLRFGVSQTFKEKLISHLKSTFFSLNVDETTSNNHQKVVTLLVNYLDEEEKKIVTKHLESFSVTVVNSNSIFVGIQEVFRRNKIPWKNLMSVLLDSCNVMRGKKSGVETRMLAHSPHLLDIDGDSCHHAHNAAKEFCKPFSRYLENLVIDIHNDLKWSPDLRAILSLVCEILNIKYTMPQNFISIRWLSIYSAAQDLFRLFNALVLFYFSFLSSSMRTEFLHVIVKIFKQHELGEEGKNKIRNLQSSLRKKILTEAGKDRKNRIATKLIENQLQTKLNLCLFISVLPLLQEYVKLFQTSSPLIHLLYDKQIKLLKEFMACFMKPEVLLQIGNSAKKIKQLQVEKSNFHLSSKCIFIGDSAKHMIALAPKASSEMVKTFQKNTLKAYIACTKALQSKMPITNRFLKVVSSIDPKCRHHSLSLQFMKELPDHAKNVIGFDEREMYDLETTRYQIDFFSQPNTREDIETWWIGVKKSEKYPLLSRMALALLTCFHGPKVESSFSIMNNIITPESSRMNVPTFSAIQSIKYELCARKTSSVDLFKKENYLKDPVDKVLCRNIRSACKRYSEEKLQNKISKEARRMEYTTKKQKVLSKIAAKKLCAKAAKKQRKKHVKSMYNLKGKSSPQHPSTLQKQDNCSVKQGVTAVVPILIDNEKSSPKIPVTLEKKKKPEDCAAKQSFKAIKVVTTTIEEIRNNTRCGALPSKKRKTSKQSLTIKEMFANASTKKCLK